MRMRQRNSFRPKGQSLPSHSDGEVAEFLGPFEGAFEYDFDWSFNQLE